MRTRRSRMIAGEPHALWELVRDPHHFPRWWPGVIRVEAVSDDRWTHVYTTKKGRAVRIDFRLLESLGPEGASDAPARRSWEQEIPGTPFERVLHAAVTEITLERAGPSATKVTIEQDQQLKGYSRTGGWMLRRATNSRLDEALDGLERIFG
jgi:carbon monoxide dehydrogenase subunit G